MRKSLYYLYAVLSPEARSRACLLLLLFIPAALLEAVAISSIMPFIDVVTDYLNALAKSPVKELFAYFGEPSPRRFYLLLGMGGLCIFLSANFMGAASVWGMQIFCRNQNREITVRLLRKYLGRPYAFFLNRNNTVTSKNILVEAENVVYTILQPTLDTVAKLATVVFIITTLVVIDPLVTLSMIGVIGFIYVAIYFGIRNSLHRIGARRVEANAGRFKTVAEAFNGIKEIKMRNCNAFMVDQFEKPLNKYTEQSCKYEIISRTTNYLVETLAFGGLVAVVLMLLVQDRATQEILARVGLYGFAAYRLMPATQRIYTNLARIRTSQECIKLVHNELYADDSECSAPQLPAEAPAALPKMKEGFSLTNIHYTYPQASTPLFKGLNFTVHKGETVGIVGKTGCGKTTLADICLGLLQPQDGNLAVDGRSLDWGRLENWQSKLGYVPQHVYLCDDTISKNIAFAVRDEELDFDRVKQAAEIAQIQGFIENELPEGYETQVGERGVRMSGGQIQRLGIARAMYHNPEIIFFDEATSALDVSTESDVMSSIFNLSGMRTIVLIAHRLDTIKRCSRIVMLDKGKVVAEGSYSELSEQSAPFRHFTQQMAADK